MVTGVPLVDVASAGVSISIWWSPLQQVGDLSEHRCKVILFLDQRQALVELVVSPGVLFGARMHDALHSDHRADERDHQPDVDVVAVAECRCEQDHRPTIPYETSFSGTSRNIWLPHGFCGV